MQKLIAFCQTNLIGLGQILKFKQTLSYNTFAKLSR